MLSYAPRAYLAFAAAVSAVYFVTGVDIAYNVVGLGTCVAILVGVRLHRPPAWIGWVLVAAGQMIWAVADILWDHVWGDQFPSPSDALYLVGYAAGALGIALIIRRVTRGATGGHVDATLLALCVGLSAWLIFVEGRLTGSPLAEAVSLAYPAFDLVMLTLLVRLTFVRGRREPAWWMLVASMALLFVVDAFYVLPALQNTYVAGALLDAGWLASYALIGAAGLHRSMSRLVEPAERQNEMPGVRIVLLGIVLLTVPLAAIYAQLSTGSVNVVVVAAIACPIVFLIFGRVTLLVRHMEAVREAALRSERKFRAVFESAPIGISLGTDGMLTDTNPAFQRMLGYSAEELQGMHFRDVTHPDDADRSAGLVAALSAGDLPADPFDKRYVRKDGAVRDAQVRVARAFDGSFAIGLIEDVTDRNELEGQLRQSQKMEAVGKLAGGIAHDFNNLMTAVIGYSDLLLAELDPRQAERVGEIRKAAERASELTRQLLAFSRKQLLRVEQLDLRDVVSELEPLLARLLGERIEVRFEPGPDEIVVVGDRAQLEQVLMNLAVNARDAMPGGGEIAIDVHADRGEAVLCVSDTGVGMTADVQARIFEPFFSTKHPTEATGLGLSTVYGIVTQTGGTVDVVSAPGDGAEFVVRLPLAPAADVADERLHERAA